MQRVLIPLDGTHLSEAALEAVHRLFASQGYTLTLLRVVPDPPESGSSYAAWGPVGEWLDAVPSLGERVAHAQAYLEAVRARLEPAVPCRTEVRIGPPVQAIREAVREDSIDMVAMATHARSGLGRLLLGSVTDRVMRSVPVPVLVVRPAPRDLPSIDLARRTEAPKPWHRAQGVEPRRSAHIVVPLTSRGKVAPSGSGHRPPSTSVHR